MRWAVVDLDGKVFNTYFTSKKKAQAYIDEVKSNPEKYISTNLVIERR